MQTVSIGALSSETGVKIPTIRYYESIGLLDAADRSANNRRLYGPNDTRRLRFIRHARELGFEVEAIRQLLALAGDRDRPCEDADAIATAHLADIDHKIARLSALREEVARMTAEDCHGTISDCRILEALAEPCDRHRPYPESASPGRVF